MPVIKDKAALRIFFLTWCLLHVCEKCRSPIQSTYFIYLLPYETGRRLRWAQNRALYRQAPRAAALKNSQWQEMVHDESSLISPGLSNMKTDKGSLEGPLSSVGQCSPAGTLNNAKWLCKCNPSFCFCSHLIELGRHNNPKGYFHVLCSGIMIFKHVMPCLAKNALPPPRDNYNS